MSTSLELLCRQCQYDLRGLHYEGKCPECGLPISKSLEVQIRKLMRIAEYLPARRDLLIWVAVQYALWFVVAGLSYVLMSAVAAPAGASFLYLIVAIASVFAVLLFIRNLLFSVHQFLDQSLERGPWGFGPRSVQRTQLPIVLLLVALAVAVVAWGSFSEALASLLLLGFSLPAALQTNAVLVDVFQHCQANRDKRRAYGWFAVGSIATTATALLPILLQMGPFTVTMLFTLIAGLMTWLASLFVQIDTATLRVAQEFAKRRTTLDAEMLRLTSAEQPPQQLAGNPENPRPAEEHQQ